MEMKRGIRKPSLVAELIQWKGPKLLRADDKNFGTKNKEHSNCPNCNKSVILELHSEAYENMSLLCLSCGEIWGDDFEEFINDLEDIWNLLDE